MSKTFKSAVSHREVRIWPTDAGFAIAAIDDVSNESTSTQLAPTDAPAIALAILEAAGHRPAAYDPERLSGDDLLAYIAHKLAVHVGDEVKRAKEAADRSEAEGLGRKLYNADRSACDLIWEDLAPASKRRWVDRMARAREIIGATK